MGSNRKKNEKDKRRRTALGGEDTAEIFRGVDGGDLRERGGQIELSKKKNAAQNDEPIGAINKQRGVVCIAIKGGTSRRRNHVQEERFRER